MMELGEQLGLTLIFDNNATAMTHQDGSDWHIEVSPQEDTLLICSPLCALSESPYTAEHYLRINTELLSLGGAWIGVDTCDTINMYYIRALHDLTTAQAADTLNQLVGLRRKLIQ